jgi:hypothetical protein
MNTNFTKFVKIKTPKKLPAGVGEIPKERQTVLQAKK